MDLINWRKSILSLPSSRVSTSSNETEGIFACFPATQFPDATQVNNVDDFALAEHPNIPSVSKHCAAVSLLRTNSLGGGPRNPIIWAMCLNGS